MSGRWRRWQSGEIRRPLSKFLIKLRPATIGLLGLCLGLALAPAPARAIIVLGINGRNSFEPTGDLANSGWQYQGGWQSGLGTAIAPNVFLTAQHSGGGVGDPFVFQGKTYLATEIFDSTNSDLRVVKVDGSFGAFAPLYSGADEVGKDLIAFGRGAERGIELYVGNTTAGWLLGKADGEKSWGANNVSAIYQEGGRTGDLLGFAFDETGSANESLLTPGDSGGGLFIKDSDGQWKLAGVNYGVTGPYRAGDDPNAAVFDAALYDRRGLRQRQPDGSYALQTGDAPAPGVSSATRVSSNLAFIHDILDEPTLENPTSPLNSGDSPTLAPEPASFALLAAGSALALGLAWRKRRGQRA